MSLNRPRSLGRQKPPRAITIPIHPYTQPPAAHDPPPCLSSVDLNLSSYLPSMEESLQEWLTRNIPEATNSPSPLNALYNEVCSCCGKHDCEHTATLYKAMRKLESDTRLAAEIGQGLLHKHEALVAETNQTKDVLEQQLDEFREKVSTLESLLVDAENSKQDLMEQKNQFHWNWKKSQKALEEITLDFEKANERCVEIGNELKNKTKEVEKLRIFKFMVRQADYREDMLRSQLEDTNQELAISRKKELMLESKYKNLKTRYETVCTTYENLKLDDDDDDPSPTCQTKANTGSSYRQLEYLWKSNEQLRNDIIKLTSLISQPLDSQDNPHDTQHQPDQNYLITLIKELALANAKLKMDLLSGNLSNLEKSFDSPTDLDENNTDVSMDETLVALLPALCQPDPLMAGGGDERDVKRLGASTPQIDPLLQPGQHNEEDTLMANGFDTHLQQESTLYSASTSDLLTKVPSPTTSTSLPTSKPDVIHYHYHYHMQNKKRQMLANTNAALQKTKRNNSQQSTTLDQTPRPSQAPKITLSPTSPTLIPAADSKKEGNGTNDNDDDKRTTPYHQLQSHASLVLDRLKSTDIRLLNRRLQRAFDMMELSSMSNSILDSILADILLLDGRFLWLKQTANGGDNDDLTVYGSQIQQQLQHEDPSNVTATFLSAFLPTLTLMQSMLKEIGELRMTMNDLQVEYVKKVEEIQHLVEQDILRKHRQECNNKTYITPAPSSSLSTAKQQQGAAGSGSGRALAWLSNMFHISASPLGSTTSMPPPITTKANSTNTIASDPSRRSIRYQRSCDSMLTARHSSFYDVHPSTVPHSNSNSSNNSNKQLVVTTSSSNLRIKQKKNEFDRFGPPSSFPRSASMNDQQKRRRRSGSNQVKQHYGFPLRPSVSAGPMRKSNPSPGIWATATKISVGGSSPPPQSPTPQLPASQEKTVERKRSLLGLGGSSEPLDKLDSADWKLGTSFGGSWLGT